MNRTILLALDGSAKDERGIAVATAFAELVGAAVHMVHVVNPPDDLTRSAGVLAVLDAVHVPRSTIEARLQAAALEVRGILGEAAMASTEILEDHDVSAALLRAAAASDPRAIVLATHGSTAIGRAVHGSIADEIVRSAKRPVLLVPQRADGSPGHGRRMRRILVPLDGSDAAREIIAHLLDLAPAGRLELVLLRAVGRERTGGHAMPPGDGHAESHLGEIADRLQGLGARVEVQLVESGDPGSAIVAAIREKMVDLVAMTTRGAGGMRRLLHGSVATRVARESDVPVLLVTPGA